MTTASPADTLPIKGTQPTVRHSLEWRTGPPHAAGLHSQRSTRPRADPIADGRYGCSIAAGSSRRRISCTSPVCATRLLGATVEEVLDTGRASGRLVGTDDDRQARSGPVGCFELRLRRPTVEGAIDPQSGSPQLRGQVPCRGAAREVHYEGIQPSAVSQASGQAVAFAGEQDAVDAQGEPHGRRVRATKCLYQPVVATASADGVLRRLQPGRDVLEGRARVVVQPPDQLRVDRVRDPEPRRARI